MACNSSSPDACRGLRESAAEYLPDARVAALDWVDFYRNIFSHAPATKVREVSHMLKAIHSQDKPKMRPTERRARSSSTTCAPPG